MANDQNTRYTRDYFCTKCGKRTDRNRLTVKKSVFTEMGSKAKTFKSRAIAHLCDRPTCLPADKDWRLPPYSEPEFEVMPEGFDDEDDDKIENEGDGSVQLELPLEPAHLLER